MCGLVLFKNNRYTNIKSVLWLNILIKRYSKKNKLQLFSFYVPLHELGLHDELRAWRPSRTGLAADDILHEMSLHLCTEQPNKRCFKSPRVQLYQWSSNPITRNASGYPSFDRFGELGRMGHRPNRDLSITRKNCTRLGLLFPPLEIEVEDIPMC